LVDELFPSCTPQLTHLYNSDSTQATLLIARKL